MHENESPAAASGRRRFARFAWLALAWNVAVVISGAYVRATGSGNGCGDHWPLCNGQFTPVTSNIHTVIEYSHRALTGLDTPLVLLLVIWAFRAFGRGHLARKAAVLSGLFLATEAAFGAVLVLSQHVVKNADPYLNSVHLANTLTLLACLALTAHWAVGKPDPLPQGKAAWIAGITLASVILLAVTGAIAALGDTLYPARSLSAGIAQDFDPASSILLRLRALHPLIAAAVAGWLTVYSVGRLRSDRHFALSVIILVWAQLLAGLVNLLLQAPIWMQLLHLMVADLLWIALVLLCVKPAVRGQIFRS